MRYSLGGYAAPTQSGPTFLIPYFVRRGSNNSFAQQVDDHRSISAFLLFDTSAVPRTFPPTAVIHREEGDVAVMAFVDADDNVIAGTAPEVESILNSENPDLAEAPFVQIELLQFLGKKAEAAEAVARAAAMFEVSRSAEVWKASELASNARAPRVERPDTEIDHILDRLAGIDDEAKWARSWTRAWVKFPRDQKLEGAALAWMDIAQSNKRISSVLCQLLSAQPSQKTINATLNWLEDRAPTRWWARTFAAALPHLNASEPVVRRAFELMPKGGLGEIGNNQWARLWMALRERFGPTRELLSAARTSLPRLTGGMGKATVVFERCVADFPSELRGATVLGEWFPAPRGNLWAEIFLRLFQKDAEIELIRLGLDWLRSNPVELRTWEPVWTALATTNSSPEVYELGNRFVLNGRPNARSWPIVLITLLADGKADTETTLLALRWLEANKGHSLYGRIRFLIENPT